MRPFAIAKENRMGERVPVGAYTMRSSCPTAMPSPMVSIEHCRHPGTWLKVLSVLYSELVNLWSIRPARSCACWLQWLSSLSFAQGAITVSPRFQLPSGDPGRQGPGSRRPAHAWLVRQSYMSFRRASKQWPVDPEQVRERSEGSYIPVVLSLMCSCRRGVLVVSLPGFAGAGVCCTIV